MLNGERMSMGEVKYEILHMPGLTQEHISMLVRDHLRGDEFLMLSGAALLVTDVVCTDLPRS